MNRIASIFVLVLTPVIVTLGQDLDGCGVSKGCFKQPPTCTGDDCEAYVTWETTVDGQTQFAMRAERTAGLAWVGLGLRPSAYTSGMAPADVYACTNQMEVKRSQNTPGLDSVAVDTPNGTLSNESVTFANNVINCVFTRQASLEGDATFYNISGENEYYILLALGDRINGDGTIEGHYHKSKYFTEQPVMLQGGFDGPSTTPSMPVPPGDELKGCDETKGCFVQPEGCSGNDCTAYVTWQVEGDGRTRFTMRAQRTQGLDWVAFGLRPSAETSGMSPADVYACTSNSEVRRSENVSPWNSASREIPNGLVTTESVTFENNVITCEFLRQPSLAGDATVYNISGENKFYILLAIGGAINADGSIQNQRHNDRWASGSPLSLSEFGPVATQSQALAKAHGALMVIAWIGLATIGITMAHYFKPMWPNSTLFSQKVWFTIHRMCMVTCVIFTLVAFVLIFVHVKGFVQGRNTAVAHGVIGIIVTALGIINPTMALFRPHPGTPNRPYFNWAHWGVGTCAHSLAYVAVFLGIGYNSGGLLSGGTPNFAFFTLIAFIVIHILIVILFEVGQCVAKRNDKSNDIAMSGDNSQQAATSNTNEPADSMLKTILLCCYVGVATVAIAIVIAGIALS